MVLTRAAVAVCSAFLLSSFLVTGRSAAQAPANNTPAKPLTVEAIFAHGPLIGHPPDALTWSPDGKHLTYLDGGELVDLDLETGKPHVMVSRAKLAALAGSGDSEIDRDHRERYKMASYLWAPDSAHLLFDANGRLWLYNLHNGTGVQVGFTGAASGDDPKFSPNGDMVSFVRDHGLWTLRLKMGALPPIAVASAPNPAVLNGEVDWVYEEEMETHSNYFWSPDSKNLAYLQMNESQVPTYPIGDWIPTHALIDPQHYPQPGDPNPDVRVGVAPASGGKTIWMRIPIHAAEDYIPRFGWVDARTLWVETITRDHHQRNIYFANAANGESHSVLQLTDDKFLDDNYDVSVGSGSIVLTNWSDGHNHIYLYSYDGANLGSTTAKLERQLTHGEFEVGDIAGVDFAQKTVRFSSNEGNAQEQQLWVVDFAGERKPLTTEAGTHEGNFAPTNGGFVDKFSTRMQAPTLQLCASAGHCNTFWSTRVLEPYHLRAPQQLEVKAKDGTVLEGTLLMPDGATSPASVPLIVNPYGGPAVQTVTNRWADGLLFDELLAQHGFAVLHVDNRGMSMRGRDFAQAAYHNFGPIQLEDQLAAVDAVLAQNPQLDSKRLGWWGWSWGGTFTLYALSHSDRFRAGVAVAPVTNWRNYDSIYTERYLGSPAENASLYNDFSDTTSASSLKGHLLLVQGTSDDNVHFENLIQYIQKLIDAQIPYDLQLYPRKTHSIAGPDVRTHLFNRILNHFETYLK